MYWRGATAMSIPLSETSVSSPDGANVPVSRARWALSPLVVVSCVLNSFTLAGIAIAVLLSCGVLLAGQLQQQVSPVVLWLSSAACCLLIAIGVFAACNRIGLLKHAVRAKGDIVGVGHRPALLRTKFGPSRIYTFEIQFADENSQPRNGECTAALYGFDVPREGSRIDIIYDCRRPERVAVVELMEQGYLFDTDRVVRLKHGWISAAALIGVIAVVVGMSALTLYILKLRS